MVPAMLSADAISPTLEAVARACIDCMRRGEKILLAGNGGNAADAQHIAGELVSRFAFDRPGLPAIALDRSGQDERLHRRYTWRCRTRCSSSTETHFSR